MDQHSTAKTATQMTPEGDSSDLAPATSSSKDTTTAPGVSYFNFLGLSRELRDMVYDQFQRLHPDTPAFREDGRPEPMVSRPVKTKPITPLLLVNKMIGSEYKDACEKRTGVVVSAHMQRLMLGASYEEKILLKNAAKASFIHMHAGDWMNGFWDDDPEWTLSPLKDWLAHWDSRMPKLDSITVRISLCLYIIESDVDRRKLEDALEDLVSVPKLKELEVVTMNNAMNWKRVERDTNSRKLLVHWTSSGASRPTLIDSPPPYVETCCELLGPYKSIFDGISYDSDGSSSHSDDGSDDDSNDGNDGDDGNGSNDIDEDNDHDFESDDENNNAGNGSTGGMDDGDEEDAESEYQDDSEDSDGAGADATSNTKTNQSPSYFDFFGLPPEIRDMIYDQPELLDQETPLCHDNNTEPHCSVSRMAATKPRTSLLLVNSRFGSEYERRCEGRSGIVISDMLFNFTCEGWQNEVKIPPRAAANVSSMHIHVGNWMDIFGDNPYLSTFEEWLAHWMPQMPKLETMTVNLYTDHENVEEPGDREDLIKQLDGLLLVEELTELKVIGMAEAELWQCNDEEKRLLVDWKRGSGALPQLMYPPLDYEEKCCNWSLTSDTEEHNRLRHGEDDDVEMRDEQDACGE